MSIRVTYLRQDENSAVTLPFKTAPIGATKFRKRYDKFCFILHFIDHKNQASAQVAQAEIHRNWQEPHCHFSSNFNDFTKTICIPTLSLTNSTQRIQLQHPHQFFATLTFGCLWQRCACLGIVL